MAQKDLLVGVYDDDHVLLDAVKELRRKDVKIDNVYTPFPVHGLDHAMGLRESRIPTAGFIFGISGTLLALLMQTFMYSIDWRINVAGKPFFPLPSFIPITFEVTVLLASLGMVGVYLARNYIGPGAPTKILDPRQTDDRFLITVERGDDAGNETVKSLYEQTGAVEVREQQL